MPSIQLDDNCVRKNLSQIQGRGDNVFAKWDTSRFTEYVNLRNNDPKKFEDINEAKAITDLASGRTDEILEDLHDALVAIEAKGRDEPRLNAVLVAADKLGIRINPDEGELEVIDALADNVGRAMRGVINEYRKDKNFASAVEQAISMDDESAERFLTDFAKRLYGENAGFVPYTPDRALASANAADPIASLVNSITRQMEQGYAGVDAIMRFREAPVVIDTKAVRTAGLKSWRQFILDNPEIMGYPELPSLKAEIDGGAISVERKQEFERFVAESYNFHAYGKITDVSLINRGETGRFRFQLNDFDKWQKLHGTYGHKKNIGAHLAREVSDRVQQAGREVGIKRAFGSDATGFAEKLLKYLDHSVEAKTKLWGLSHRRTHAMLEVIANNDVRTNDFAPKIGRAIDNMIDAIQLDDDELLDGMMTEIEKRIKRSNYLPAVSKFVLRDLWKPASAAKLAAAPLLIPGDVIMRAEISSDVGSLRHSFFGKSVIDGVTQTAALLPYLGGKIWGVLPGTRRNPMLEFAYNYTGVANQEILSMVQAENSRMFAMAQTSGWSNKAYRVYESITGQGAFNEMPFLISRMNARTQIMNYIGADYEALQNGTVGDNPFKRRGAAEFYQTTLRNKITKAQWTKLNKAGSVEKLKETDYDTWLTIDSVINENAELWSGRGTARQEWTLMKPEWVGTPKGDVAAAATVFTGYVNKMYENIWNRWRSNYQAGIQMRQAAEAEEFTSALNAGEEPTAPSASGGNISDIALVGGRGLAYASTIFAAMYMAIYAKESLLKNRKIDLRDKNDFRWIMSQTLAYSGAGLWLTDTMGSVWGLREYEKTASSLGTVVQTRAPGVGIGWDAISNVFPVFGHYWWLMGHSMNDGMNTKETRQFQLYANRLVESAIPTKSLPARAAANYLLSSSQRRKKYREFPGSRGANTPEEIGRWALQRAADTPRGGSARYRPGQILDPRLWKKAFKESNPAK